MKNNEIIRLLPLQIIQNDIEEGSKNGKKRFALREWEYKLDLDHIRIVSILWAIEQKRVDAGKRGFIKHESYNEKGRPCLSEIEIPEDNKIGHLKVEGERVKRRRAVRGKINKHNKWLEAMEKDMKRLKRRGGFKGKFLLLSDSRKRKALSNQRNKKRRNHDARENAISR